MPTLQELASERSGVPQDEAFALDAAQPSLYARLGRGPFEQLARAFYDRVYADDEAPWFRWGVRVWCGRQSAGGRG